MDDQATAEEIREILKLWKWSTRRLAIFWGCTEACIYQWLSTGKVTRGLQTWAVRETLKKARLTPAPDETKKNGHAKNGKRAVGAAK